MMDRDPGMLHVLEALLAMRLSALVIDIALLGQSAFDYLERVRARLPSLAVVVCTIWPIATAVAFANKRASDCSDPHDRFRQPDGTRRVIASATQDLSAPGHRQQGGDYYSCPTPAV